MGGGVSVHGRSFTRSEGGRKRRGEGGDNRKD